MARRRHRYGFSRWGDYVPVDVRRARAERLAAKASKEGRALQPVRIAGRKLATTPWGMAWCAHIERYHDFSNRLPRGRTYARNGSLIDLRISEGRIRAQVVGSQLYQQLIDIRPCKPALWKRVVARCEGSVSSLIELLSGQVSERTMAEMTADADGILPDLSQVKLSCTCPDWARLCKHLAAVLYGVGARLDEQPELLFTLRGVDPRDMAATASKLTDREGPTRRLEGDLSAVFGIDLEDEPQPKPKPKPRARARSKPSRGASAKTDPEAGGYRTRYRLKRSGEIEELVDAGDGVRRQELVSQGVPAGTISNWIRQGLLLPSGVRGLYWHTAQSRRRLKEYLE